MAMSGNLGGEAGHGLDSGEGITLRYKGYVQRLSTGWDSVECTYGHCNEMENVKGHVLVCVWSVWFYLVNFCS